MTTKKEKELKDSFLRRNQLAETGIPAAVRRNKLYADNVSSQKKNEIVNYWREQLEELAKKYSKEQTRDTFVQDVRNLMHKMNANFKGSFASSGFRFSHAQKSLSVLLKYRWCEGIIERLTICPIDRNVLGKMTTPYKYWSWTKLSDDNYLRVYTELERMAKEKKCSVAQMELEWFEDIHK